MPGHDEAPQKKKARACHAGLFVFEIFAVQKMEAKV